MGVVSVKATEREPFWRFALAILAGGGRTVLLSLRLFVLLSCLVAVSASSQEPQPEPVCIPVLFAVPDQICFDNDAIYLGSGTGAVDGNGWLCDGLLLLPATGQTTLGLPFPAIDVFHSGYVYVSSPTPGGTLGPYWFFGLERMCVVLSSGNQRLPGTSPGSTAWRGTPTEVILQPTGGGDIPESAKRVRELTVYDADGSAMRFLAFIMSEPDDVSPFTERWSIVPTKGVQASLEAVVDETGSVRGFVLRGGPPGRIREGGEWTYHFAPPQRIGWGNGYKSRLHDFMSFSPQPAIVSPSGNRWSLQVGEYVEAQWRQNWNGRWLVLRDFQTKRGLRWDRLTGEVFYFALNNELHGVRIGRVPPESVPNEPDQPNDHWDVQWDNAEQQITARLGLDRSYQIYGSNRLQEKLNLTWEPVPEREREMYLRAYGTLPENLLGRLKEIKLEQLLPEQYQHMYAGSTSFWTGIQRQRPSGNYRASLVYSWDRGSGMFTQLENLRPSYVQNPNRAWEKEVLLFEAQNGQVVQSAVYDQVGVGPNGEPVFSQTPRWQESYSYSPEHPFALTLHTDREGTQWEFTYVPNNPNTLLQDFRVNGGALGEAHLRYGEAHPDAPGGSHPNPPTALTHLQIGSDPALSWRFDYTYRGQPYSEVSANSLLTAFTEPGRSGWWQLRYWGENSAYPNKLHEVEDPTGRLLRISAYDLFGRPVRVELYPNDPETPLWSETEWTLLGQPRRMRWGFGTAPGGQSLWEWDGLFLRRYIDPRGRWVRFVYDFDGSGSRAGLLRQIWLEWQDDQGNLQSALYAEMQYDSAGRLVRVENGGAPPNTKVGLTYGYGIHDELRSIHHDGDTRPETFDYSCCGRVSQWTRQDGRFATFEYTLNGRVQTIHEHSASGGAHTRHEFSYDPAGRLGVATKQLLTSQGWQDQVALRWWYDTDDPNYGVSADPRNQDSDPTNNFLSARTGWLLGEQVNLPVGSYYWLYDYRTPEGALTADLQTFTTSWGSVWRYQYDGAGRPIALFAGSTLFAEWSYDNAGRLQNQTVYLPAGTLSATIEYADTQAPNAVGLLTYRLNGQLIAQFDYWGTADEPGYYPDGTLRSAREWLPDNRTAEWRWEYYPDGSLQSETSRLDGGTPKEVQFAYDVNGNLTRWGDNASDWRYDYNRLWWIGGSHPHGGSYNWYMTYTPNGERARLWNAPQPIKGDVNGDGVVDDADLVAVQFAFGQQCPQGCPEDLNRDGQVDDEDLMIVLFNFGQSAGEVSWGYRYDVWGNLVVASSSQAGVVLNAIYDSLGRRVGLQGVRSGVPFEVWRLYEGDTLLAEVDGQGRVVAEYVWGPLGPIARLDYSGSGVSCYYVLDALGHVRVLLSSGGEVLEVWRYDSWGVPLSPPENLIPQPFLWNGAYGYEWDCFGGTGLYHVGARAYDPRTARWLQRDPIDAASGDPNLYRYCGNDPINFVDPTGTDWNYHDLLDAAGFIPVVGDLADAANAIGYALEGDYVNAAISAASALGGDVLKAGRLAKKVVQEVVEEGAEQVAKREAKNALQEQGKKEAKREKPKVCQPPKKPTRYTPHARERMRERGISEQDVEDIMRHDKSPRKQPNGRYKYKRGNVEVIVEPDGTVVTVIVK
ncbi:RHS repeat-associated core domain-containing protein [Armatimonadetes bacterium DC]|nr:RHS repeat-associated core domain-containing protein [Armatimonadetes bacterium DC]